MFGIVYGECPHIFATEPVTPQRDINKKGLPYDENDETPSKK